MSKEAHVSIDDWAPMRHQVEVLRWAPPRELLPGPSKLAILGGWGSAKTRGAAMITALHALRNGWTPEWGKERPRAVVISPTLTMAEENQLDLIESLFPPETMLRRWGRPKPRILLRNGVEIVAASAEGAFDGGNLQLVWADEIHREAFANNALLMVNMIARLRHPKARDLRFIATGLPTAGFVRNTFEGLEQGKKGLGIVRRWATALNTKLPPANKEEIMRECPAGMEGTLLKGEWGTIPDAAFPQWNDSLHLTDDPGERGIPVDVALDAGNRSRALFGQRKPMSVRRSNGAIATEPGLLVVDEILGQGLSMAELVDLASKRGWRIEPGHSRIFADPTLRLDEVNAIRARFPGVMVVIRHRDEPEYWEDYGSRLLQSKLRDSLGNTLVQFARSLARVPKGVVDAMQSLKSRPDGTPRTNDRRDHSADALRYLGCGVFGRLATAPQVSRR